MSKQYLVRFENYNDNTSENFISYSVFNENQLNKFQTKMTEFIEAEGSFEIETKSENTIELTPADVKNKFTITEIDDDKANFINNVMMVETADITPRDILEYICGE